MVSQTTLSLILLYALIVAIVCFCVGLFVGETRAGKATTHLVIEPVAIENSEIAKRVVVSKRGSTYYPWWCTAAENMVVENRRWFSSGEIAKRAGYTRSKQCE